MQGLTLELIVPQKKNNRDEIRRAVNSFFKNVELNPPISYESMKEYAQILMCKNNWGQQDFAYIMLCCGNAVWRNVFGTIPFERRILLLPECLKSMSSCKAVHDEFGLLCNGCGGCEIAGLIDFAEELGYIALVSEGTTVTTRLIESGQVEGVIGVGCMSVLEKMFSSVTKYAIPGIGIPLLGDGCQGTELDVEWLKEELTNYIQSSSVKLINLRELRKVVNSFFNKNTVAKIIFEGESDTEETARSFLLEGGRRWRPFLATLVYSAMVKNPDRCVMQRLAFSVECFHKASLVHDDIEDNDVERYGKDTLHKRLGVPVALNVGDLLIGEGYRLLAETKLDSRVLTECIKVASAGHVALTIGQGEELSFDHKRGVMSVDRVIKLFENKTSAAFRVSILIGALAGVADDDILSQLEQYSRNIGIAYQIKDDLEDYKDGRDDIRKRRFSIILSLFFETLSDFEKKNILTLLAKENFEDLFQFIDKSKTVDAAEELLKLYIQQASGSIEQLRKPSLKLALYEILGQIFGDYM